MKLILETNIIPRAVAPLLDLGNVALTGAQTYGAEINLEQNTAPRLAADQYDLIGDPATPLIPGKQARYAAAVAAVGVASAAKDAAIVAGRDFCRQAINLLKPTFGYRWNSRWQAAGFLAPSLAAPRYNPGPMLDALREYFAANPARENAPANITAARAGQLKNALYSTHDALAAAERNRIDRKAERDEALEKLRERLTGLRNELGQLLEDNDGIWYSFGFRRPVDAKIPTALTGLVITPATPGTILVRWQASSRAENYRVTWRLAAASSGTEPTQVGLFVDEECTIAGLPSGTNIVVAVSARNRAGETQPKEAAVLVP